MLILYGLFCIVGDTARRQITIDERATALLSGIQPENYFEPDEQLLSETAKRLRAVSEWIMRGPKRNVPQIEETLLDEASAENPNNRAASDAEKAPYAWKYKPVWLLIAALLGTLAALALLSANRLLPMWLGKFLGLLTLSIVALLLLPPADWLWTAAVSDHAGTTGIRAIIVGAFLSLLTVLWNSSALSADWLKVVGYAFRALGLCLLPLLTFWQIGIWRKNHWDEEVWKSIDRNRVSPVSLPVGSGAPPLLPGFDKPSVPEAHPIPQAPALPPAPSATAVPENQSTVDASLYAKAENLVKSATSDSAAEGEKPFTEFRQENIGRANKAIEAALSQLEAKDKSRVKPRIYVHVATERDASLVRESINIFRDSGYSVPGVQAVRKRAPKITEIRYQDRAAEQSARDIATTLSNVIRQPVTILYVPPTAEEARQSRDLSTHFEIWFGTSAIK